MRRDRITRGLPAIGLGLALSYSSTGLAQGQGPRPNTGSGSGTGTGMSSGFPGSTGTGRESGSGPGSTGTGAEGISTSPLPRVLPNPNLTIPLNRRTVTGEGDLGTGLGGLSSVSPDLFLDARSVADPGERALALVRIAEAAIFSKQLDEAHAALFEAGAAALAATDRLIREQRLTAIVLALKDLAEERINTYSDVEPSTTDDLSTPPQAGRGATPPGNPPQSPTPAAEALPEQTRKSRLQAALPEWAQAVALARRVEPITPRTELLFRIVESEAYSSARLITDPLKFSRELPDPSKLPADLRGYTDGLLASASQHANMIERPIWRNMAAFTIVSNAAVSSQFTRGFQIARGIDQPEARTDALIRLAEGQAQNGRPEEATAAYNEAARSVALIPQEDPRETLVGVLIDSLITYGRFEDARACVPLYSFPSRQLVALSAVAESQGRRGLAESARLWIGRETPPAFRPLLYRKVNDGILATIEKNRSRDLTNQGR